MARYIKRQLCNIVVTALIAATIVFFVSVVFIALTSEDTESGEIALQEIEIDRLQKHIKKINRVLRAKTIKAKKLRRTLLNRRTPSKMCPATPSHYSATTDFLMPAVYDKVDVDVINNEEVPVDQKKLPRLDVILVPFSHTPFEGHKTFEDFYKEDVRPILDGMLDYLKRHGDMKFVYDDLSFFERWWSDLKDAARKDVKKLLETGQLELAMGSWTSTNEVSSHFYATLMEMMEGHEFLVNQLNYRPSTHLSLNKLGLSPIKTFMAKKSHLTHSVIHHAHSSVKQHLAKFKNLEFIWRQLWAGDEDLTDLITHVLLNGSYDVLHSCGPDPKICCQFDFRRVHEIGCDNGPAPKIINWRNVAQRARILADQYRQKAKLFNTNVLLIPHGGDFRYGKGEFEWQHENYRKLIAQINADKSLNMRVQIGTFKDYFDLSDAQRDEDALSLISGDFFIYADQKDQLYTGYYTGRPFFKHFDRILGRYLRSADISFSLAHRKLKTSDDSWPGIGLYAQLVEARRTLSVIQNDGGRRMNAKVARDYEEKVIRAIENSRYIIASASEYLLNIPTTTPKLKVIEHHINGANIPEVRIVNEGDIIVVENSLGHARDEVICIHVASLKSSVKDVSIRTTPPQQIEPIVKVSDDGTRLIFDTEVYRLCFRAENISPFGLMRFELLRTRTPEVIATIESSVPLQFDDSVRMWKVKPIGSVVKLGNGLVTALFDAKMGLLTSMRMVSQKQSEIVNISFVEYDIRAQTADFFDSKETLLLPEGKSRPILMKDGIFVIVKGPIRGSVIVKGPKELKLLHEVSLELGGTQLGIRNVIGASGRANSEVAMRIRTKFAQGDRFYTELNGYQLIRRKRYPNLPLHSTIFPMPGAAYLEGDFRLTLLGRQSLGVASLRPGQLEVFLNRRISHDAASPFDETPSTMLAESHFRLILEHFTTAAPVSQSESDDLVGYHSIATSILASHFEYPPVVMTGSLNFKEKSEALTRAAGLAQPLPCDVHPVALRTLSHPTTYRNNRDPKTLPKTSIAFVLHRVGVECRIQRKIPVICGNLLKSNKLLLNYLFKESYESAHTASLTLLYTEEGTEIEHTTLLPNDMKTVMLRF